MKHEEFKVGNRVKMKDPDDGIIYTGTIIEVREKSVIIKWPDLFDPCEHFEEEFGQIKHCG